MPNLDDEIQIEVTREGDPWRNVEVGDAWLDLYSNTWLVPVELVLAPNNVYADAVLSGHDTDYRFQYTIELVPTGSVGVDTVYAKTIYPEPYPQEGETPFFHMFVPMYEDWPVRGMKGEAKLSGNYQKGTVFQVRLKELDWELMTESYVEEAEQTIYLGGLIGGKFLVSLSDSFFEHKYIWWWGEEQTVHCYECIQTYLPGMIPITVPNLLVPPIKKVVKVEEVAEFTSADGLELGKLYAFGIEVFHATDQALNNLTYRFGEGTQEVYLVPVPGIGNSICPLLGVDPKSYECTLELAEFLDPIYVANTLRKIVEHKDIAGNTAEPDNIDYIFLPIALLSGLIPAGTLGKKLAGPILKKTGKLSVVDKWLEDSKELIQAAIIRGDDINMEVALDRVKGAAEAVEGSGHQKSLLDEASSLLEDVISDSKLTKEDIVQKQKFFVEEIGKKLDDVKSKTPADEVVEKSGLKNAKHYIPGLAKPKLDNTEKFRTAARERGLTEDQIDTLYKIEKDMIENDLVKQTGKSRGRKLIDAMKAHPLWTFTIATTAFGIVTMAVWFSIDNVPMTIFTLRRADIIEETWGQQWYEYGDNIGDLQFKLKEFPCSEIYQTDYVHTLSRMRTLLDGADPIPEEKVEQAKYALDVIYGKDIGDPNERVKADCETAYDTAKLTYCQLTSGCRAPLPPPGGWEEEIPEAYEFTVKVETVIDGDTMFVSWPEGDWIHEENEEVRLLGVDTTDVERSGSTILGYSIRRKDIPDKTAPEEPVAPMTKNEYDAATKFTRMLIEKQQVKIRIDPENLRDRLGRLLATLYVDRPEQEGIPAFRGDLGKELLRKGLAKVFFYTPNALINEDVQDEYLRAETEAREADRGVWSAEAAALPTGNIHCISRPSSASIYLNDETAPKGKTEKTLKDIRIGDHNVEFRGTTKCKHCGCGYDITLEEDETELVECELSAIYEIEDAYWEDEGGTRWRGKELAEPMVYIDTGAYGRTDPTGTHAPCTIAFGRKYTSADVYTPLRFGTGALIRDANLGMRTIELRKAGYKTMVEQIDMQPGMHVTRIAAMERGDEDVVIPIGEGEPPEPSEPENPGELKVFVFVLKEGVETSATGTVTIRDMEGTLLYSKSTSNYSFDLEEGSYDVNVAKVDYIAQGRRVSIVTNETTTEKFVLEPTEGEPPEPEGEVILTIRKPYYAGPDGREYIDKAKVDIDGTLEGLFTYSISELKLSVGIGAHTITLKATGYDNKYISIYLEADHYIGSQEMTKVVFQAATIVDPTTYPREFNVGYTKLCPITIVNASDTDATFVVSQIFRGIDVIYTMTFPSEEVNVSAGADKIVNIPVTIPEEAIPVGMDVANYAIYTRLELI